jgi:hypothetical protein
MSWTGSRSIGTTWGTRKSYKLVLLTCLRMIEVMKVQPQSCNGQRNRTQSGPVLELFFVPKGLTIRHAYLLSGKGRMFARIESWCRYTKENSPICMLFVRDRAFSYENIYI